eukprot:537881-Prorocentrum_lima.AAC.1
MKRWGRSCWDSGGGSRGGRDGDVGNGNCNGMTVGGGHLCNVIHCRLEVRGRGRGIEAVSYTHLRAHETRRHL